MTYKIISQEGNQTLIETEINGEVKQSLIVCNPNELDDCVQTFISSVINPKIFTPVEIDSSVKQSALNKLIALGLTQEEALTLSYN